MISAILAAMGSASGDVFAKIILDYRKFSVRKYLPLLFLLLALITLVFVPSTYALDTAKFFSLKYIFLFVLMLFAAVSWNIRFYTSIQKESLHEFELVILLSPLATVILAAIFYPDERDIGYFIATIIASLALVGSRLRRSHISITNNIKRSFWAMIFIAIEVIILKELLHIFSPTLLYFARTLVLATIYFIWYRPKVADYTAEKATCALVFVSASLGVLYMVMKYYAFQNIGIVQTTLIMLLAPLLTYLASYFYFKEHRMFKRDLGAAIIILLCLGYVILT